MTKIERQDRESSDNLKSLVKLVRVLDCFSFNDRALSLGEICQRTGFPRSTAHRLMSSLRDVGLLDQDRERDRYRLGLRLFELGSIALSNLDLIREARPLAESLRRISGKAVHIAIFDGARAVVIYRSESLNDASATGNMIENAPAHCTSVGKVILAYQSDAIVDRLLQGGLTRFTDTTITNVADLKAELTRIRERGYAVDDAEHQPGIRCVGAPVRSERGQVFAGISVSGPTWQMPVAEVEDLSKVVIHHAASISQRLGYHTPPVSHP